MVAVVANCNERYSKTPSDNMESGAGETEGNPATNESAKTVIVESDCPYETTLEAGIDFGRSCWPSLLKSVEGISDVYWKKPNAMRSTDATKAPSLKLIFSKLRQVLQLLFQKLIFPI